MGRLRVLLDLWDDTTKKKIKVTRAQRSLEILLSPWMWIFNRVERLPDDVCHNVTYVPAVTVLGPGWAQSRPAQDWRGGAVVF